METHEYCDGCGEQFPVCYCKDIDTKRDYISNRDTGDENDESKWIKSQETNAELLMRPTIQVEDIKKALDEEKPPNCS